MNILLFISIFFLLIHLILFYKLLLYFKPLSHVFKEYKSKICEYNRDFSFLSKDLYSTPKIFHKLSK